MSLGNSGPKSNVERTSEGFIQKSYVQPGADDTSEGYKDSILTANSSNKPPIYGARKETRILEVMSDVPDGTRLPPKLYSYDLKSDPPYIVMEEIVGDTYRDLIVEASLIGRGNVIELVSEIPDDVAAMHAQLRDNTDELRARVRWGKTQGLRFRPLFEERSRLWHYLRTVVYAISPDLRDLRSKKGSKDAKNRKIRSYIQGCLGLENFVNFIENFISNHSRIMYGVTPSLKSFGGSSSPHFEDRQIEELIESGLVGVIHGDLGPHHLLPGGRCFDFDESRIESPIYDLTSAMYSTLLFPLSEEDELGLLKASFAYHKASVEHTPSEEENALFAIRLVEARLLQSIRLFAADCKASLDQLKQLVKGDPSYRGVSDENLRDEVITRMFVGGMRPIFDFYLRGPGQQYFSTVKGVEEEARLLYNQLRSVEDFFYMTKVFEGIGEPEVVRRLEDIVESGGESYGSGDIIKSSV